MQHRIRTAREDEVQRAWGLSDQASEDLEDVWVLEVLGVVQHQDELFEVFQVVCQLRREHLGGRKARTGE